MEGLERFGARAFNEDELESSVIQQHFNFVQEDNLPSLLSVVAESGSLDCLLKPTSPLSNKQLNILNKLNSLTKRALQLQPQRGSAATLSRSDELCIKEQILSAVYGRAKRERQEELQLQRKNSQAKSRQRSNVEERKETPSELPTPQDTELLVRTGKLTPLDRLKGLHSSENKPERRDAKGKVSRNGQQRHDSAKASKSPWEKALSRGKRKKKKSDRGKSTVKRKKSSATANIDTKKPAASEGSACPVCQREFRLEYLEKHVEKCLSRPRVAGSEDTSEQTARGSTSASSEGGVEEERDGDEVTVDTDSDSSSALSSGSRIGGFVLQDDSSETRYKGRLRRYESAEKRWSALLKKFKEEGKTQQECFECALATVEAEEDDPGAIDITPQRGVAGSVKDEKSVEERIQSIYKKIDVVRLEGGLKIPSSLYAKLFEYQRTGIKWLSQLDTQGTGGILGDEQGLGKTCQICSFLGALKCSNRLKTSLIVCPATTLSIWVEELNRWHAPIRAYVLHSSGSAKSVAQWSTGKIVLKALQEGDVIITTYQGLRLQRSMLLPHKWGYVILDEGHKLKNPDADITLVAKQLQTTHRIIVSGTPIQNNLKELWSLFDFVYPGRLGTLPMFQNQFSIPINAGGYANASNMQVQMAYRCAMVLKESIAPYLLRRLKKDVAKQLPSKTEQVLFCNLTPAQTQLYENYLSKPEVIDIINGRASGRKGRDSGSVKQTFGLIRMLQHICNHPLLFENKRASNEGYEVDVASSTNPTFRLSTVDTLVAASGKLQVLRAILRKWRDQGHRALVFSQSKQMLSILESLMHGEGYPYLRMDGDTSVKKRGPLIARFNDKKSNLFVFLLTTKVGGVGINLTGANRVVLFDPDWNPSNDSQARERAWRIGQKKDVTIYRLITSGTIEEKIYHRQIFKQYLTNKVNGYELP